jgi:hypothetical protein
MGNYGFDKVYNDFVKTSCAAVEVPIATVHVWLNCLKKGRLLVPASFQTPEGSWATANVLVDTGAMANFISKEFVCRHDLAV